MTRTRRFLGGVTLGTLQLVLATAVGLWMTPFLLGRVGSRVLGFWLVAQQLLGYLLLLDLGVNALLPRESAYAVGRAGVLEGPDLTTVVSRARQAVFWQMPLVVVAAIVAAWITVTKVRSDAAPLLLVLTIFVVMFPARLYQALLQGLQDLVFLGRLQILAWGLTTALTVWLVLEGQGLWALAIGWAAGQVVTAAAAWAQVRYAHPGVWPDRSVRPPWAEVRPYVVNAGWISVAQFAQVLLSGSDLLMVGSLLGSGAVVLYSCTSKLTSVLANQPQILMVSATPALSELWAAGKRERLFDLVSALTLAMLTLSGFIACLTLAANQGFVTWWVGRAQYGGTLLTVALAIQILLRHWNITLIYGMLAFGLERRVSVTNLADGVATIVLSLVFIRLSGPIGAVIGSTLAVLVTSLPSNLIAISRRTGTTPWTWCVPLVPWAVRVTAIGIACAALAHVWVPSTVWQLVLVGSGVSVVYFAVMAHGLRSGPLAAFAKPHLAQWLGPRLTWLMT